MLSGSPLDPRALATCCLPQASCCLWVPPYSTGSCDANRRGQDKTILAALVVADNAVVVATSAGLANKRQRQRRSGVFPGARFVVDLALPETTPLLRRLHFGKHNYEAINDSNISVGSSASSGRKSDSSPSSGLSSVVSAVTVDRLLALSCCQPTVQDLYSS